MVRPFGTGSIPGVLRPPTPLWVYAAEESQQRDLIIGGAAQFRADQPSVQICGNAIGIAPVEGNHLLLGIFEHNLVAGAEMNSFGMPIPLMFRTVSKKCSMSVSRVVSASMRY